MRAFQLHHSSSSHCKSLRKIVPILLLPGKRALFDVGQKAVIPSDCFFYVKSSAPHCNVLKNISEVMKIKKLNNEIVNETTDFATLMALRIDEIHIQPRHLFRDKNCVCTVS